MRSCWLHVRDGQKSVTAQRSTHPPPSLTPDQIRHILEGACLLAVPINGEGLVHKGLGHKVTHDATVIQCHPGPIGVEDAHHPDLQGWSTTQTTSNLGQTCSRRATSKRRREQAFNEQDGHLCRGLPCTACSQSSAPPQQALYASRATLCSALRRWPRALAMSRCNQSIAQVRGLSGAEHKLPPRSHLRCVSKARDAAASLTQQPPSQGRSKAFGVSPPGCVRAGSQRPGTLQRACPRHSSCARQWG